MLRHINFSLPVTISISTKNYILPKQDQLYITPYTLICKRQLAASSIHPILIYLGRGVCRLYSYKMCTARQRTVSEYHIREHFYPNQTQDWTSNRNLSIYLELPKEPRTEPSLTGQNQLIILDPQGRYHSLTPLRHTRFRWPCTPGLYQWNPPPWSEFFVSFIIASHICGWDY